MNVLSTHSMVDTPNHNYNIPSEGTTDWHIPLNENFEQLDIDVEIRGPESNKGNHEPTIGSKYEATDSGAIYYGNGDVWILADRRVNQLQADSMSTKQIQSDGPRIVSPSISGGYDSLQTAIDDSAEDGFGKIWVAEDIQENVVIPTDGVDWVPHRGLMIVGSSGTMTEIKDARGDDTPVIEVETGSAPELTLSNLIIEPLNRSDPAEYRTRAFSWSPEEDGYDRGPSIPHLTIQNCRFEAPSIIGLQFFTTLFNSTFRSQVETVYSPSNGASNGFSSESIAPGVLSRGGNQIYNIRCNFVNKTQTLKYGAYWTAKQRANYHAGCHYNVAPEGQDNYYADVDRTVGAILLDGGGDFMFTMPYCEGEADSAVVFNSVLSGDNIDGAGFYHPRLHTMTADQRVDGLVVQSPEITVTMTEGTGYFAPGSYVEHTDDNTGIIIDGNPNYLRVYRPKPKGWEVENLPNPPDSTGTSRINANNHPVLVYDTGGSGRVVTDWRSSEQVTIPDDNGPIYLGMRDRVSYKNQVPTEWKWFGLH